MEGRFVKCLLYVLSDCNDPAREEEFNEWYNHTHLPDLVGSGLFRTAIRFSKAEGSLDPDGPKYLAVYESDSDDPGGLMEEVDKLGARLNEQGRVTDALQSRAVSFLQRLDGGFWTRRLDRKTQGLSIASTNCSDPAREGDFQDWYTGIHQPDVLSTGGFHTSSIYTSVNQVDGLGKYVCMYETDLHTSQALEKFNAKSPGFREKGRSGTLTQLVKRAQYMRLCPDA